MKTAHVILAICLLTLLTGCRQGDIVHTITGQSMGTTYSIKYRGVEQQNELLKTKIDKLLSGVVALASTYDPESELSKINRAYTTGWQDVSEEMANLLSNAIAMSELTDGAFDISIGPIVNLWGFGATSVNKQKLPPVEAIRYALGLTGYTRLRIDTDKNRFRKMHGNMYIDLSGIAKGYAVDQVAELLKKENIAEYMVEIGGEISATGASNKKDAWRIGIEAPTPHQRQVQKVVRLSNMAMASSGNYRNFFAAGEKEYSHTLDPRTGKPIDHNLASVTVFDASCMRADALATGLLVLGSEDGFALAERENIPALFILKDGSDLFEKPTQNFRQLFE